MRLAAAFIAVGSFALAGVAPLSAANRDLAAVPAAAGKRSKAEIRWLQDRAAKEKAIAQVRALLERPLTLPAAVQIALLNSRELQAHFEEVGLSFADLRDARVLPNPTADLAVKFPDRAPTAPLYEWGIAQNFLNLLMIPLRARVARDHLEAAQLRAGDAVIALVSEVKSAFYRMQGDAAELVQLRLMQEGQSASLQLMQKLHAAGNVTDLALTREQAAYSEARLEIGRAEATEREDREKFNRLLGLWGRDTSWKLAGELPPPPNDEITLRGLETLAVARRMDLGAARRHLESTVRALGLEKTFRYVGVLDFGLAGESDPDKTKLLGPSLRLELPLFQQGQARIARGEAELRRVEDQLEALAVQIRSEVRELRDRLVFQRETARFYREDLAPLRRRITAQTLAQYNAMLIGAFEAFQARRDDVAAERGIIEATRDYWITRAALERAVGGDLTPEQPLHRIGSPKADLSAPSKSAKP